MRNIIFSNNLFFSEISFFILRFFTGVMMCYYHGWSKLFASVDRWERLGNNLTKWLGLDELSIPLGFLATFSESIGALMLAIGLLTRPTSFLLAFTMLVATIKKLLEGGLDTIELPFLFLILSLVILLKGSGNYSLDRFLFNK